MYMMNILINNVIIKVQCGKEEGTEIHTNVGTCQGDCLSAVLFIVYLAASIRPIPEFIEREDYKARMWSFLDWLVHRDSHNINIDPKYS